MIGLRLLARRAVVVVAVILSLAVGAMAVRAAAVWTQASAPLTVAPESVAALTQRLADEQARSAALEEHLTTLTAQTEELTVALKSATDRIAKDAKTAKALRDKLAAAKRKLAAMNRAAGRSSARVATSASASGGGGGGGGGDEDEDGEGEDVDG
jgi:septal ring factor EnvC (AmiA/AmiB activator)